MAIKDLRENDGFLLKNQTSDIASPDGYTSDGDRKAVHVFGNLGGGAIQIQATTDNNETNFVDIKDNAGTSITFSAPGMHMIDIYKKGMAYRATLTGSTAADVSVKLV